MELTSSRMSQKMRFFQRVWMITLLLLIAALGGMAQTAGCDNLDFAQSNFTNWTAKTGSYNFCCPTVGVVSGRHTIINTATFAPGTCNGLSTLPPGVNTAAKLGNEQGGGNAETLEYTITVDSSNAILVYSYAVVLQDPGHSPFLQPKFNVEILDNNGNIVDPVCGLYSVTAAPGLPGFNDCGQVRWRDWTTVGLNLLPYQNQTITIRFSTFDCGLAAHHGFAYLTGGCRPINVEVDYCAGDSSAALTAPPGFSYNWSTGDTTQSIVVDSVSPGSVVTATLTAVNGCQVNISATVNPTTIDAGFTAPLQTCVQDSLTFTDTSSIENGIIDGYFWDFGDGTLDTGNVVKYKYSNPGFYDVQLIVTRLSCSDTVIKTIEITAPPQPNFGINTPCIAQFTNINDSSIVTSGFGIESWEWDIFNDGTPDDSGSVATYLFSSSGTFSVKLTVQDSIGCVADTVKQIEILSKPEAAIKAANVCLGAPVLFFDSTTIADGVITEWSWDFGDSSTIQTVQNPQHEYQNPGSYFVFFVVTSNFGCTDTLSQLLEIVVHPLPETAFNVDDPCLNEAAEFFDASTISIGNVTEWEWYFGPGKIDSVQNPTLMYNDTGLFPVSLIAYSEDGCATLAEDTVRVLEVPQVQFTTMNVCLNEVADFQDMTTTFGTPFSTWEWELGDQNSAVDQNPTHLYATADTFEVKLTVVTDSTACRDSVKNDIVIYPLPEPMFGFQNVCEDSVAKFTDFSLSDNSSQMMNWYWDIGADGSIESIQPNTTNIYSLFGTYPVELRVTDSLSCTDSLTRNIVIHPEPVADFSYIDVCLTDSTNFTDLSTIPQGQVTDWKWLFGDQGLISFEQNPGYLYSTPDTFDVYLTVTSDSGCMGLTQIPKRAIVFDLPKAGFDFTNVCDYDSVPFTDTSKLVPAGSTQNTWTWNFGDGSAASNSQNPKHFYSSFGYYPVSLSIETPDGCTDATTQVVQVYEAPESAFTAPTVCLEDTFQLNNISIVGSSPLQSWTWTFGDGAGSTDEDPRHAYDSLATYRATLVVLTSDGCIDSSSKDLPVNPVPVAAFTYDLGCARNPISFYQQASIDAPGVLNTWTWDFGDFAGVSQSINPVYTYDSGSTYPVKLIVTSAVGCQDSITQLTQILQELKPSFVNLPAEGCPPLGVAFTNQTTFEAGYDVWYEWKLTGDTLLYTDVDPAFTFYNRGQEPKLLDMKLRAITDYCEAEIEVKEVVSVWPQPTAGFNLRPEKVSVFDGLITMLDDSEYALYRTWDFGDGSPENYALSTNHRYMEPGTYGITQWVENDFGCMDSLRKPVYIWPEHAIWIPNAFTPNGDGLNDVFPIYGEGIGDNLKLQIFNRWGELIYTGNGPQSSWNGRLNGRLAQEGVYVYRITYTDLKIGEDREHTGTVTLIHKQD